MVFDMSLKTGLQVLNGHIYINNYEKYFEDISQDLRVIKEIKFIDSNISDQVLISANSETRGIILKSFNPDNISHYEFKGKNNSNFTQPLLNEIFLGSKLAERLVLR